MSDKRTLGIWYAFGREDAGETLVADAGEFGKAFATAWTDYEEGRRATMTSVRQAFALWQLGKTF